MQLQIFDVDYVLLDNRPVVRLFCKDIIGNTICVFTKGPKPYFYLDPKNDIHDTLYELEKMGLKTEIVEKYLPIGYSEKPKKVIKIIGTNPAKIPEIKNAVKHLGTPYEADILYKYRYMVDAGLRAMKWIDVEGNFIRTTTVKCKAIQAKKITSIENVKNAPLRYLSFDIECITDEYRMPDANFDPIIMISMAFYPEYKNMKQLVLITKKINKTCNAIVCSDEKQMLEKFKEIIIDFDPDVLAGYNIENFDVPYILKRMQLYNIPTDIGRAEKKAWTKNLSYTQRTAITGRFLLDPYYIIRYLSVYDQPHKFRRFNLDTVANQLLGKGKKDLNHNQMLEYWKSNDINKITKIAEYCQTDSDLVLELIISHKLVDMDKFIEMSKLSGLTLQDLMAGQSARHENALLHEVKKRNILMPCKPDRNTIKARASNKFKGATVLEPDVGLHKDGYILVLDFKSMYPSMIMHYNICPSTLLREEKNISPDDYYVSPVNAKFVKKNIREGIFPYVARYYFDTRFKVKDLMKKETNEEILKLLDAKQYALKGMLVSLWGYIGFVGARFFTPEVAASITGWGRYNIDVTKKLVEENFGYKVIYGDSVTKDRFVTIIDNNIVKIKNIEELFQEHKNNLFRRGEKEIVIPERTIKVLSVDPKTKKPVWRKINEIIRHKTSKKIYRVNQKFGETIVTEDHSLITLQNGNFVESKPKEMLNKSMIRVDKIPNVKQINKIDLYEILKHYSKTTVYKGKKRISCIHKDKNYVWFGWTKRKKRIKLKRFIYVRSKEFESLCRLLGLYISEGSASTIETTKHKMCASICSSDKQLLKQIKQDYLRLFKNSKASIIRSTKKTRNLTYKTNNGKEKNIIYKDKTYKLQMTNELAAVFFKILGGQKSKNKKLPDFIYHVPQKYKELLLEYMIKGDGSRWADARYSNKYKKENFRYDTKSLHLICGLSFLLNQLNQKYTIRYDYNKKTYRITTCSNYRKSINAKLKVEKYSGYVYDLNVDNSHMFVDSCGQILLHNTDSVFVKTDITDLEEAAKKGEEMAKFITQKLEGMELEFEKAFKTFLILSKKRYAGWQFEKRADGWKDKIAFKGIEVVRRDWCPLTTKTMKKVLETILKEGDTKAAAKYVRKIIHDLNKGLIPIEDLAVVKGITKPLDQYDNVQPHVELAKKIIKRDPTVGSMVGQRLPYVIIKGNELVSRRAEDPNYIKEKNLEIDSEYYIKNQILPPLERIFETCGVSQSELLEGSKQTTLFDMINSGTKPISPEDMVLNSFDAVVCNKCHWSDRRPPLRGCCPKCGGNLYFSGNGSIGKTIEIK
ncbi:MAG: ribonuclease H-like domain-containing protein [Candidatus Aenigmarchaeota archaeon]|nr:ribonuclease H-like domain-containing protein [Candidatus Aenigmarchaeota archaeon]